MQLQKREVKAARSAATTVYSPGVAQGQQQNQGSAPLPALWPRQVLTAVRQHLSRSSDQPGQDSLLSQSASALNAVEQQRQQLQRRVGGEGKLLLGGSASHKAGGADGGKSTVASDTWMGTLAEKGTPGILLGAQPVAGQPTERLDRLGNLLSPGVRLLARDGDCTQQEHNKTELTDLG